MSCKTCKALGFKSGKLLDSAVRLTWLDLWVSAEIARVWSNRKVGNSRKHRQFCSLCVLSKA